MSNDNTVAPIEEIEAGVPAVYEYSGRGFEDDTPDEKQIPFVTLLQSNSPQVTGQDGVDVPGAKAGKFFNNVSGEVIGDSFNFIPVKKQHVFVEWKPRSAGGGFLGMRQVDDPVVLAAKQASKEFGKYTTPEGNTLTDTIYLFGLLESEDGPLQPTCIAFTSTKIKAYRAWNSTVNAFTVPGPVAGGPRQRPDRWAHRITVKSKATKNAKGSFYVLDLKPSVEGSISKSLLPTNDPRFAAGAALADAITAGSAKISNDAVASSSEENEADQAF